MRNNNELIQWSERRCFKISHWGEILYFLVNRNEFYLEINSFIVIYINFFEIIVINLILIFSRLLILLASPSSRRLLLASSQ